MVVKYKKIVIYLWILLVYPLAYPLAAFGQEINKDKVNERLFKLDDTLLKAKKMVASSEVLETQELLKKTLDLRKEVDLYLKDNLHDKADACISKALYLAQKSINLVITKELLPKRLNKLEKTIAKNKVLVDQSNKEEVKSLYEKINQSYSLAKNLYQETEYNLSLKQLKEAFSLIKEMDSLLNLREDTEKRLRQATDFLKSNYQEIATSKNKGAIYFIKRSNCLSKEAPSLIREEKYKEALGIILEIEEGMSKALSLVKGEKIKPFSSLEFSKELKYLEELYLKAQEKITNLKSTQIQETSQQVEVLKKNISLQVKEQLLEEATANLYQCSYLINKLIYLSEKESKTFSTTEERVNNLQNEISKVELIVRESGEEEAFILLWQAKQIYTKTSISLAKNETTKALEDLKEISTLMAKARQVAERSVNFTKKLNWRISHLEKLICKIEDYLKEGLDQETIDKIKKWLWKAKESKTRANILLALRENEKTLYHINEGLNYAQKALFYISQSNLLDIEEATQFELLRLEDLISKTENKITETSSDKISGDKIKNVIRDAKKVELMALKAFKRKDFKEALENIRKAANLAYQVMGIEEEGEERSKFETISAKMKQLEKILIEAKDLNQEERNKEAKEYLDKAEEIQKKALLSFYVTEDYSEAEREIEEALKYGLLSIKKMEEESPDQVIQKKLLQGKELIEEAKEKVVLSNEKEAKKVLSLSEEYFNKANDYFTKKDYPKAIDNLGLSKSLAIKAIKIATEY
ncbi:hypothetical protein KKB84_02665 [bacterium]|nr:hypothetical protein [bacterium]